jgi:uncharacterized protein (TIGR00290 family)
MWAAMGQDIVLYWSGGKDCAMALQRIATSESYRDCRVTRLLTTMTRGYDRVSGHGVRRELLERQAECLGIDLDLAYIPQQATMDEYEAVMEDALRRHRAGGGAVAASGDIFVEKRRIGTFKKAGLRSCFPLYRRNPLRHTRELLRLGFQAYIVCVDSTVLAKSFVGRQIDEALLAELPPGVDPCGENGEFHTFVFDGPIFRRRVRCRLGRVVHREWFYFCDVLPED